MGYQLPVKTSSTQSRAQYPGASAPDGSQDSPIRTPESPIRTPESPRSPALSTVSTADGEASPELPPLPAPKLPDRVLGLIRTPPPSRGEISDQDRHSTVSWDSPYPAHLREASLSSGASEDSPVHNLEIITPFLRTAPLIQYSGPEPQTTSLVSAAVLANRARRPARGLTEDWIRQHTAGDEDTERRHWLSDGAGDSENSSLSGSFSGDDAAWLEEQEILTPRATRLHSRGHRQASRRYPRTRSSNETLKQAHLLQQSEATDLTMAAPEESTTIGEMAEQSTPSPTLEQEIHQPPVETPKKDGRMGLTGSQDANEGEKPLPATPPRAPLKRAPTTPRLKKRVPWKGKNIMVLLPRDEERGQPDKTPFPLSEEAVAAMLKDWERLGYNIRGFDLDGPEGFSVLSEYSQSRGAWPDFDDISKERAERSFKVLLPDLNAWKKYVEELNEAKLRALGVSFGDEEPPPPSISPASTLSRQPSVTHYPPLPFSPPIPTSSASSNHATQGFSFPGQFVPGGISPATQSPGIPGVVSPASFNGKYNPRASISIPSPHGQGWSPQALLQQGGLPRGGSPALNSLGALVSPASPFSPDGMPGPVHQRHQSLQYPIIPHQFHQPARLSPRLQELREVEEEAASKSPSKTPEPAARAALNANDSLQKEIDEAEYHLEEQMRSQLDNDKAYSPHNEDGKVEPVSATAPLPALRAPDTSAQFGQQPLRFGGESEGPVLHHPRPHSRGHSLSQKYFTEEDANATKEGTFKPTPLQTADNRIPEDSEIETNPSNLGTPVQSVGLNKLLHQRSFSTASNPWTDNESAKSTSDFSFNGQRRPSHGSKTSLSKLNVQAPEFKFNPTNTFKPGQFVFGGNTQPITATAVVSAPLSASSSQFSFPATTSSKINVNAPVFSPGQTDFSFSIKGPKFRPDAPAFTPLHSLSDSITSPASGNESVSNRASSIFGNVDLKSMDIVKPAKKSKAIPIVRPSSRQSQEPIESQEDPDWRSKDEARVKRARGSAKDDDDVPQFAKPVEESTPVPELRSREIDEGEASAHDKSFDETSVPADTAFSSTMVSETTDTKATVSPSETSPAQASMNWAPFEFKDHLDMQSFNDARPFGEDTFKKTHKKSLSATAKAFVPGASLWGQPAEESEAEPINKPVQEPVEEPEHEAEPEAVEEEPIRESTEVPEEPPLDVKPSSAPTSVPPQPRGLQASRFASAVSPGPSAKGLSASRFAVTPSPPPAQPDDHSVPLSPVSPLRADEAEEVQPVVSPVEVDDTQQIVPLPADASTPLSGGDERVEESIDAENQTFDDIDAVMRHLHDNPSMGVNKTVSQPQWHQPSPQRRISLSGVANASPLHLPTQAQYRSDALSPSPRQYRSLPGEVPPPILTTELEDPFVDPPRSALQSVSQSASLDGHVHRLNASGSLPASEWDGDFTEDEQTKLESRVNFFDGHVNRLVDTLLVSRLVPLERTLDGIKHAVALISRRTPSSRRERRSTSVEIQESDADDEDDEMPVLRRSMSPRRDRRMEQIRAAVLDAFAVQQRNMPAQASPQPAAQPAADSAILRALEEMREQFSQSLHLDFRGEDLRNIVEDAVERRMPLTPVSTDGGKEKMAELQARVDELEQRLRLEGSKLESEVTARRAAEDRAAELNKSLEFAETRVEIEIMNKSAFDQRVADLEDRLQQQQSKTEQEAETRRAAEDRLSEVQRLLRIASEEENRLRELLQERDQKIKATEASQGKSAMRLTLLEAAQSNSQQSQSELQNRANILEVDLRDARQEARHWKSEFDRVDETARRQEDDLAHVLGENRAMRKVVDTLRTTLQENERIRDSWRAKFNSLQEDMAKAAAEIAAENARRAKKEQALLARQEVLDAKLQAEAKTRERIETEMQRLEDVERQGIRAVSECKRLEAVLLELRNENHKLHQSALRYQAEFQEARESGAREVQRTRDSMQSEVDEANHQVNVVREELEDQIGRVRAQLDQVKLDADTSRARHEMLLEEAQNSKTVELEELARRHQNEMEDMQARYERQLNNTTEDAQRSEQNLLERLSISASKSEHLQDKVAHLEEKLEIAKEAAKAAAQAAKSSIGSPEPAAQPVPVLASKSVSRAMEPPEKISPQALRESIMVLQEQLQEREQKIEQLEQVLSKVDPEAAVKISKRDDEIIWLRELLAVRHSDLQDIIAALQREDYDKNAVKDAAIRLKANLQMEEQERERAMNGGSAINLPNIAATIREAASPRVAQAVGPLAAAWGNWRKSRDPSGFGSLSSVLSSPAPAAGSNSTPSRSSPASQGSFLGGLLTPPASGLRQSPTTSETPGPSQPTAFSATGRRYTSQQLANRPRGASLTPRQAEKQPVATTPSKRGASGPVTPPMMRPSAYDEDAQAEDFDSTGFFDD